MVGAKNSDVTKFHHNAKTGAHNLYDVLIKYGPKILSSEECRMLNRKICEVYLEIHYDDVDKFKSKLKRLNTLSTEYLDCLKECHSFLVDHSSDNPLKSLNRSILEILEGGKISDRTISELVDKMKFEPPKTKLKTKTLLTSISEEVIERYIRESRNVPNEIKEIDRRRIKLWISDIGEHGIDQVSADGQWGDHALGLKDVFKGKRSVCLSDAGRVIYKVDEKISGETLTKIITIIRITSTHDYFED